MSPPSFLRVFKHGDVSDQILDKCTPLRIFRMRRTCKAAKQAVDDYISRVYKIERQLSRFFSDPASFRTLQLRTGVVISGSMALQFLDRTVYKESDLDLYVMANYAKAVYDWLEDAGYTCGQLDPVTQEVVRLSHSDLYYDLQYWPRIFEKKEGFHAEGRSDPSYRGEYRRYPPTPSNEYFRVFNFYSSPDNSERRKIQLMISTASPVAQIMAFHSCKKYGTISQHCVSTYENLQRLL